MTALLIAWTAVWLGAGIIIGYVFGQDAENKRWLALVEKKYRERSRS